MAKALADFEHRSFRGFLWTVTSNKIKDYWRTRQQQFVAQGGSDVQELLANIEVESSQSVGKVDTATRIVFDSVVKLVRSEFSDQDWKLFWDYAVDGKAAATVAEEHGVNRNQVFLAKSRILRRIRAEFGEEGPSS